MQTFDFLLVPWASFARFSKAKLSLLPFCHFITRISLFRYLIQFWTLMNQLFLPRLPLMRPVMWTNPSASVFPRSPDLSRNISSNVSFVFSSSFRYPMKIFRPSIHTYIHKIQTSVYVLFMWRACILYRRLYCFILLYILYSCSRSPPLRRSWI